jgi:hypothetical protein
MYWLFVDAKTRAVSRRLSQSDAEDFVRNMGAISIDQWWVWNPMFRDWLPLRNIVDHREGQRRMLIQLVAREVAAAPSDEVTQAIPHEALIASQQGRPPGATPETKEPKENTQAKKLPEEYSEIRSFLVENGDYELRDFHGDDLTFSRPPKASALSFGADRRRATRTAKQVEVLIAGRGKSFRTMTVNISMTGVMLEKPLPTELSTGPFEIVFIINSKKGKNFRNYSTTGADCNC